MLSDLINQLWGSGKWRNDFRVKELLKRGELWPYEEAIQAIQMESRIADKFFSLSNEQRNEIITVTAALIANSDIPAPIRGGYAKFK